MKPQHNVGGQAIIEGIMMRSPHSLAIAIRRASGEIVVTERPWEAIWSRLKFLRLPFIRGSVVLIEALVNGIQALYFSAHHAMLDEEERLRREENGEEGAEPETPLNPDELDDKDGAVSRWALYGTIVLSLGLGFALFKGLPHLLTTFVGLQTDQVLFHVIDGLIKITLFIGYILLVARLPDMRRVFQYHGAEHKSIYAYENGEDLTVENARKYTTLHPRCGTSFILIVLLSSIFIFMVVFPFLPRFHPHWFVNALLQVAVKLPLMLPIAGLAYEFQRFSSRHMDHWLIRLATKPGLWMQLITTKEPDDSQLEIALVALRKALWRESVGVDDLYDKERKIEVYRNLAETGF